MKVLLISVGAEVCFIKFIQLGGEALLPLKPMDQSRRGVIQAMEAQVHPLIMVIPRFIQLYAKALKFE
jgi:hypothetical protein